MGQSLYHDPQAARSLRVMGGHQLILLNRVAREVLIGLGEFSKAGLIVNGWFGQLEATHAISNVGCDFRDTVDLLQITSDRGGTAASRHIGNT